VSRGRATSNVVRFLTRGKVGREVWVQEVTLDKLTSPKGAEGQKNTSWNLQKELNIT